MTRGKHSILAILGLVLSFTLLVTAIPASPVLALEVPPATDVSSPSGAALPTWGVYAWGSRGTMGLGDGTVGDKPTPVRVSGLSEVVDISAGYSHDLAVLSDSTVWAWGLNSNGQLGDGTTAGRNTPVKVSGLSGVVDIAAGGQHSLALKSGTVWAWGSNALGRLGNGSTAVSSPAPVQVTGLTGVTAIAAGNDHSLALKDGTVWAWGSNAFGQLGNGSTAASSPIPVQVTGLTGVTAVAAGFSRSLAVKSSDGSVWAWGFNPGDSTTSRTPVQVTGLTGVTAVAIGDRHNLALKSDKTVWAWGENTRGQLGDGTNTQKVIPVQVVFPTDEEARLGLPFSLLTDVEAVAAGDSHSLALKSDGTVLAWGYNYYGQIGDNTTYNRSTPHQVKVLAGAGVVAALDGRNFHSLALIKRPQSSVPIPSTTPPSSTLTPVTGTAPIAVAPAPVTQTPSTTTSPSAPSLTSVTGIAPVTAAPQNLGSATTTVYITPETPMNPGAGGMVSLTIMVDTGGQVVSSVDLNVLVNSSAWDVLGWNPGGLLGANPVIVTSTRISGNSHLVAARSPGNAGTETTGSLATMLLRRKSPVNPGIQTIKVTQVKLADANGQDIKIDSIKHATITAGPGAGKLGDLTGDGLVDHRDLALFGAAYGAKKTEGNYTNKADLNGDSWIDFKDLALFGANYGK